MLVFDTDHLSEFDLGYAAGRRLHNRLLKTSEETVATIVLVEEQLRGWLARIHGEPDPHRQIVVYAKLQERIRFFAPWKLLPWTAAAADQFSAFRRDRVRVGTMDLKIACIVLAHDATLLTRNTSDFARVPGLKFENWLD